MTSTTVPSILHNQLTRSQHSSTISFIDPITPDSTTRTEDDQHHPTKPDDVDNVDNDDELELDTMMKFPLPPPIRVSMESKRSHSSSKNHHQQRQQYHQQMEPRRSTDEVSISTTSSSLRQPTNLMTPMTISEIKKDQPTKTIDHHNHPTLQEMMLMETDNLTITTTTTSNRSSLIPSSTHLNLRIRYVIKDLWFTLTFPKDTTVNQARELCLMRCNLKSSTYPSNMNQSGIREIQTMESVPTIDNNNDQELYLTKYLTKSQSSETNFNSNSPSPNQLDYNNQSDYALFWNEAGHWLDDFRRLDSYPLRPTDIIELQLRNKFISLPNSHLNYHRHYAEGELMKLHNGITNTWKLRWFVLRGNQLLCFRRSKDLNPSCTADLSHPFQLEFKIMDPPHLHHHPEQSYQFNIKFGIKAWSLDAVTKDEFHHWRRILLNLQQEAKEEEDDIYPQLIHHIDDRINKRSSHHSQGSIGSIGSIDNQINPNSRMLIKTGDMYRRTNLTRSYRERYFVLKGKELSCYKSDRFDKPKHRTPAIIDLHTVDVVAYQNQGRFYFRITNQLTSNQHNDNNPDPDDNVSKPKSKFSRDVRSILSSTRSLSIKAASWMSKTTGAQLDIEYLYLTDRNQWMSWRTSFITISQLTVPIISTETIPRSTLLTTNSTRSAIFFPTNPTSTLRNGPKRSPSHPLITTTTDQVHRTRDPPTVNVRSRFSIFLGWRPPYLPRPSNQPSITTRTTTTTTAPTRYNDIDEEESTTDLDPTIISLHTALHHHPPTTSSTKSSIISSSSLSSSCHHLPPPHHDQGRGELILPPSTSFYTDHPITATAVTSNQGQRQFPWSQRRPPPPPTTNYS